MPDANRNPTFTIYKNGAPIMEGQDFGTLIRNAQAQGIDLTGTMIQNLQPGQMSQNAPMIPTQQFAQQNGVTLPPSPTTQSPIQPIGPAQGPTQNPPSVPIDTPPLPTVPGLTAPPPGSTAPVNPGTPVNTATVPGQGVSPYIPTTSQQQQDITNQGIAQSQQVAGQDVSQLQSILGPYVQQQFSQYTDPNSPAYQQMAGELNNQGLADSGAMPQALASRLAPLISQDYMQLGTSALEPSFTTQQGLVNQGTNTQSGLGMASLQQYIQQQQFQQQANLANQLAQEGAPGAAQQAVGMGSSILGGLGSLGTGIGGLLGGATGGTGTWICTHLQKMGLATKREVRRVHIRLRPTIYSHPLYWIHYLVCAPALIAVCDQACVPWHEVKKALVDRVLAESNPENAWQIYRSECQRLTLRYAPHLWTLEVA